MITPNFIIERRQEIEDQIDQCFSFLPKRSYNHVVKWAKQGSSILLGMLQENAMGDGRYIGVHPNVWTPAKGPQYLEILVEHGLAVQEAGSIGCCLFTNALADLNGQKPMDRVTNAGLYIHTLEIDPPADADVHQILSEQVSWLYGGGRKPNDSPIGQFYQELCEYADFRGIEAVWSGNKSIHFHVVFDVRHLAPSKFKLNRDNLIEKEFCDLPDEYLRNGFKEAWNVIKSRFEDRFNVVGIVDPAVRFPEQYRRLPFGIRKSHEGHALGVEAGADIVQLPLFSLFRKHSKQHDNWLHKPSEFLAAKRKKQATSLTKIPHTNLPEEVAHGFIEALSVFCQTLWGDPDQNPHPSSVRVEGDEVVINFFNNKMDQTPSSIIRGDHDRLLIPSVDEHDYNLPASANELLIQYLEYGNLSGRNTQEQKLTLLEKQFQQQVSSPHELREKMSPFIRTAAVGNKRCAVLTQEGGGKTTGLMEAISRDLDPDGGYILVACRSYQQAHEKCREFNEKFTGDMLSGVVLESFTEAYRNHVPPAMQITESEAAIQGHNSVLQAVYANGGQPVDILEDVKRHMWDDVRGVIPVFFTVHAVVKNWHREGGTRYWMHPGYLDRDYEEIRDQTEAQWIIYDEVDRNDIITSDKKRHVDWCRALVAKNSGWKYKSLLEQMVAFEEFRNEDDTTLEFNDAREIIETRYQQSDLIELDPSVEPFGINNSENALYARCKGRKHYAKAQNWWCKLSEDTNVTLLTTEHRIFALLDWIKEEAFSADGSRKDYFQLINFDIPNLFAKDQETVHIGLDKRANKLGLPELALELSQSDPNLWLISDMVKGPQIMTHQTAKGSNQFRGRDVTAIYTFLSPELYEELLVEDFLTGRSDLVHMYYLDMFNQTSGRTLGFRHQDGTTTCAVMSLRLWKQIGSMLIAESRYLPRL